jgi:transposase
MSVGSREQRIATWLDRLERSGLSPQRFVAKYRIPCSLMQLYRYRAAYQREGMKGLVDGRSQGNHRRIDAEAEGFLRGYVTAHPQGSRKELCEALQEQVGVQVTPPGLSGCLQRLGIRVEGASRKASPLERWCPCAGMVLVVALAWHVGWPQATAAVIHQAIVKARSSSRFASAGQPRDSRGKNRRGQFTARYNGRADVRRERFQSVELKRGRKVVECMNVVQVKPPTLARKCLAVLLLPVVTGNGAIRTVNTALGPALRSLCGFQYKQATVGRFLSELKYLGVSEGLVQHLVGFWQRLWRQESPPQEVGALLCYYVDGNTKALWSSQHVKKHKVTVLGRVMGCLEQVFIHDSHGRPLYFETYAGQAPKGEYILSLFEKIERSLEGPGAPLRVQRAIVLDAAGNSVRTLRAFASQRQYHYITSLDHNQWNPRKLRTQGRPQRYRYGAATLWDCEIELEDSTDKGYLLVTRAIRIQWDKGKETFLITSLPKSILGASVVVKAYFERWPDQELPFKGMKSVACLHRVAGYGRQQRPQPHVQKRQEELARKIQELKASVAEPLAALDAQEAQIAALIPKERRLRAKSRIVEGQRILPPEEAQALKDLSRQIDAHQRHVKAIRKAHPTCTKSSSVPSGSGCGFRAKKGSIRWMSSWIKS